MNNKLLALLGLWTFHLAILVPAFSQQTTSDSWAQFRGEGGDGISTENISKTDWSVTPPKLLWKKEIGSGFSEVIVSGETVFTMVAEKTDSIHGFEYLTAFDGATGAELWKSEVDAIFVDVDGWGDGARSTPCADENLIYCLSGNGKLSAHQKADGGLLWQRDLIKEFGSTRPRWGYSSSPLLVGGQLVMEVGGDEGRAFMAFDKHTGKTIWGSGKGAAAYSSPLITEVGGQQQILFLNGRTLYSYTAEGDTLWTYTLPIGGLTAIPVFIGPDKIFLSGVRTPAFVILRIEPDRAVEVINGTTMKNDFSSCVYHEGYIYGFHVAALRCISAETGETKWTKRGFGKGSLILVGDHLVVLSDQGKLICVETNPDAYTESGNFQALTGKSWTAPSFADGKIYVRNHTEMACYQLH